MILKKDSIPQKSDDYRIAESVFYSQFNDVEFYFEDENKEAIYLVIFRKLFPDIKLEKIFCLNGKQSILDAVNDNSGVKDKVFVVDKDFDDLLKTKESHANLFYLKKYCIENYLLEEVSVVETIIAQRHSVARDTIIPILKFNEQIVKIEESIKILVSLFVLVQKNNIGVTSCGRSIDSFTGDNKYGRVVKVKVNRYISEIKKEIKNESLNVDFENEFNKLFAKFNNKRIYQNNIPGKHISKLVFNYVKIKFSFVRMSFDQFIYSLATYAELKSLVYLQKKINDHIN